MSSLHPFLRTLWPWRCRLPSCRSMIGCCPMHRQTLCLSSCSLSYVCLSSIQPLKLDTAAPEKCLIPLLQEMHWQGNDRLLFEALPHFDRIETFQDLRTVLNRIHVKTTVYYGAVRDLSDTQLPSLRVADGDVQILVSKTGTDDFRAYSGEQGKLSSCQRRSSRVPRFIWSAMTRKRRARFRAREAGHRLLPRNFAAASCRSWQLGLS